MAYSNGKKGDIGVSVVNVVDNCYRCFPGSFELRPTSKSVLQIPQSVHKGNKETGELTHFLSFD